MAYLGDDDDDDDEDDDGDGDGKEDSKLTPIH